MHRSLRSRHTYSAYASRMSGWGAQVKVVLFQTPLKGTAQSLPDLLGVQPSAGTGAIDETDKTSYAVPALQIGKVPGIARQDIEQMSHAHQAVVAPHGISRIGKTMLILVTLVFFHEEANLDTPAVPCTQIAPGMHVARVQWSAGEPHVA